MGLDSYSVVVRHDPFAVLARDQLEESEELLDLLAVQVEWRNSRVLPIAVEIYRTLGNPFALPSSRDTDAIIQCTAEFLRHATLMHGLVATRLRATHVLAPADDLTVPPELAPPPQEEESPDWFEVRFVDEVGGPIGGLDVVFSLQGKTIKKPTNGDGRARIENVQGSFASVTVASVQALCDIVEPRWETFREPRPPSGDDVSDWVLRDVFDAESLESETPKTIVIKPRLGKIHLRLFDKTGRVIHAQREYTIDGPMSFAGMTDDDGELLHEDVPAGDYTLTLKLEFEVGDQQFADEYTSAVDVLESGAPMLIRLMGVVPQSVLARLEMFFNTNKTFLLPTALPDVRKLREVYIDNAPCELLAVGHADTTGGSAFNDKLSLERAEATIAFLKDDVEGWYKYYSESDKKKCWGKGEDHLMIISMPDFVTKPEGEDEVRWYQRTRGLHVDGEAGKDTRRALIAEYMSLDGTSLEDFVGEISATAHGCGENFPLDDSGQDLDGDAPDDKKDPIDRRVELFFFDSEFGILPQPPGPNSKPNSSEYPLWRNRVSEIVELRPGDQDGPKVTFVELADAHFRTDSAVVLPEGEDPDRKGDHEALLCMGLIATALRFNESNPGRTLLLAGHADTTGKADYNQKLSEQRAEVALCLLKGGDASRDRFGDLCDQRHTVADYKQILSWLATAFDDVAFDCDPGRIDDNEATGVTAVRRFQESYNFNKANLNPNADDLDPDGDIGPLTWKAIFDCYEYALQQELQEDAASVAALRAQLRFESSEHEFLGFGENFPVEELGVDNYRSQANRRVEVVFFEPGEAPDIAHAAEDPATSELYLPGHYKRVSLGKTVNVNPAARPTGIRVEMRFSRRKSFPKPSAIPALKAALDLMSQNPDLQLVVIGHTDAVGTDDSNQKLSKARAEAVRAWLTGDANYFVEQFHGSDAKTRWDWEELQWMLHGVRYEGAPCYVGYADGFPGARTVDALGSFQLSTSDLAVSGFADDLLVQRLCQDYVTLLSGQFADPSRVEALGGGSWHLPTEFGDGAAPEVDEASRDLRRVELFLFPKPPKPPVQSFPVQRSSPTVYQNWCHQVGNEVVAERAPFRIEAYDPDGIPLANTALVLGQVLDDKSVQVAGSVDTDERGTADVTAAPGLYQAQVQAGTASLTAGFVLDPDETCGAALAFRVSGGLAEPDSA